KGEHFLPDRGILSFGADEPSDGSGLQDVISSALGVRDIGSSKVPLRMLMHLPRSNRQVVAEGGRVDRLVRAAMALPGLFTPGTISGERAIAATSFRPFPVKEAKS